jgi:hypothetical protein
MAKVSALLIVIAASLLMAAESSSPFLNDPAKIDFDLPDTVECQEVTPTEFAIAHPTLKVIEAKVRISARIIAGAESGIVDFLYVVVSPDKKMHFQDFLPNTSLESSVADDQIEITDTTENAKGGEIGAYVGYKGVGGGLSQTKSTKKSHSSHYKEIAPRALVVASGTTDHQHGIFFRLKPSRAASLEGAKAFTFLATVPRSWRAGWCTISCAARAESKGYFSRSEVVPAGIAQSQIGLYLMGDAEANRLAEELAEVQERHAGALVAHLVKEKLFETMYEVVSTGKTASLCGVFKTSPTIKVSSSGRKELEQAQDAVANAQERLRRLSE